MTTLTDTQSLLLATAAQRESGSLLPLPASITAPAGGIARSLASLVKKELAEERETRKANETHRAEHEVRFGLYVTATGLAAIGIVDAAPQGDDVVVPASAAAPVFNPALATTARVSKAGTVLALLGRENGATLAELVEATGWLPHTTRAALTGLRKKGQTLERYKRDEVTCYRIAAAA